LDLMLRSLHDLRGRPASMGYQKAAAFEFTSI